MTKKLTAVLGLLVVLAMLVGACAAPAAPAAAPAAATEAAAEGTATEAAAQAATAEAAAPSGGPFRIALIMPSTTTDYSWSQSIYDGLKKVQEEMGGESALEIAVTENMFQVADAANAIRDYATDGYDLVIAHGAQYGTPLFEVAKDFPDTSFAWGTTTDTGADKGLNNVFAYEPAAQEGGYLNGVAAALLSEKGIIGVIGPVEAGDAKLYINGFADGVKATKPDAVVNVTYTGAFGDTALAAEAANTQIKAGADVLTGSAQQVVGSIQVAKDNNVYWFGSQSDQSGLAPEIVVMNQVYDWTSVIKDMIDSHNSGTLGGKVFTMTLNDGGQTTVYNDKSTVPADKLAEIKAAVDKAAAGIKDGSIVPAK
jgi:basic membrane lipoprotein Med (substrate-binding protein (PBP1-ABC) superfamily)